LHINSARQWSYIVSESFIFRATIARSVVRPLPCALALNVVRGKVFFGCFGLNVNERCTGLDRFNRGGERQRYTVITEKDYTCLVITEKDYTCFGKWGKDCPKFCRVYEKCYRNG